MTDEIRVAISECTTVSEPTRKAVLELVLEDGKWAVREREWGQGDTTVMTEWLGIEWVIRIASIEGDTCYDAQAVREWLGTANVRCLLRRIAAGHTVVWDGNNHVGRLDPDAQRADDVLYELLQHGDGCGERFLRTDLEAWDACEWLGDGYDTDESADTLMDVAKADGVHLVGGIDALREAMAALVEEEA